jgi:tetratricopeptide (TPR) repeat protein
MFVALLAASGVIPVRAQHGPAALAPPRLYTTSPVASDAVPQWRADLQQLVAELERNHPDPFHKLGRANFLAAVDRLNTRIPTLAAHEIIVEFERLVALVGDGHTNLNLVSGAGVDFHQLPIRFGMYDDGIYVEAADAAYRDAVGGRVVAIDGVPIDTVVARLTPLMSRDNDQWIQVVTPQLMNLIEVLHALRVANDLADVRLQVVRDGRDVAIDVKPLAQTRPRPFGYPLRAEYTNNWVDARSNSSKPAPLYQQRDEQVHWWEYVAQDRLLYIKWNSVQNRSATETAFEMFQTALTYAREHTADIDKVLLDIRDNPGGEGGLLDPIIREIVRTREIDEPGKFFVAISPRTFSAALIMSVQLGRYARPIFVGEPTGGKVNVHAGHVFATLHNSGIGVSISPALYQSGFPGDAREFVAPRLYVRPAFTDYAANRDPVYEAVLNYRPSTLAADVERMVVAGDSAGAEALVRRYAADRINRYNGAAGLVNAAGYRLVRAGDRMNALKVFRMNVRVHPTYTNGWDSLGETYADSGDVANAIKAFEQVLAREPNNGRARELLARLKRS